MRMLAIAGAVVLLTVMAPPQSRAQAQATTHKTGEGEVKALVAEFGKRLREVSVAAPKEMAIAAMDRAYSPYVAADLLAAWKNDPEKAPGKRTSSPSPERIDISTMKATGRDAFVVTGKVILLTAKERRDGGVFAANPVTMTIARRDGKWLITTYEEREGSR
jgi:hypothetical protein